jgi:outer membrane receptor protein involved in Fe transport
MASCRKNACRRIYRALILLACVVPLPGLAQQATASLNGTVRDSSGAVVPDAHIVLTNLETNILQTAVTSSAGSYSVVNIAPGEYQIEVTKTGFASAKESHIALGVNQTATLDFTLTVGKTTQTVEVSGLATNIEASTAELGTVISTKQVNDLPLNGRNFTELLTLTPGVIPISTDQNGGGWPAQPTGAFTFPSVNGQPNRSNSFRLDGVINDASFTSTYAVQPDVDDIQEFKVQAHNDEAQFGQVLGGIINVVTKSGTNTFHGDAWEFFRNDALDARNFFVQSKTPLRQNQFGGAVGGPVLLPGYNGRNKTFFYVSDEAFINHTASQHLYIVPTPAELSGNLSDLGVPIYNPYSTRPDPNNSGQFIRDAFPNAQIPAQYLNPGMVLFAKTLFPAPIDTGISGYNGRDTTAIVTDQNEPNVRIDQQFGEKDRLFFRYTRVGQTVNGSGGFQGLANTINFLSYNYAASWTHTFGPTAVSELTFGRTSMEFDTENKFRNVNSAAFDAQAGFASNFVTNFAQPGLTLVPNMSINGFIAGGENVNHAHAADIYQVREDFSKVSGKHTMRMGADVATNSMQDPVFCLCSTAFCSFQTSNLETGNGGSALASFLLGLPSSSFRGNENIVTNGGWVDGFYFQDQWKVSDRLTLNLGLRYDITLIPSSGTSKNGSDEVGDFDLNNGTYILQKTAPACSATQGEPCIPGGALPPHVVVSPNGHIIQNTKDNFQPRFGFAYRLTNTTALRGAYGRFFDNWAGITQTVNNYAYTWPNQGALGNANLNATLPNATAQDPLGLGSGPIIPPPDPFSQVTAFMDPNLRNALSDQWNLGIQQQFGMHQVLTVNYVGSHSSRIPIFLSQNVALTPGPGDPSLRAPFPYIPAEPYTRSWGRSHYHALQASLDRKAGDLTYLLAYTWSKTMDIGCDGYFSGCNIQNPNQWQDNKSVAGFDLTHVFSGSWVYELPFGPGKKWAARNRILNEVIGNWELNGIATLSSGQPYSVTAPVQISNINNGVAGTERADLIGNPYVDTTSLQPLNPLAFAAPAPYTFGNLGRNPFRSDWRRNLDLSLFRQIPFSETKKLEFRCEAFNVTNTPVFAVPDSFVSDPNFGQVSSTANTERQIQLALKFYF